VKLLFPSIRGMAVLALLSAGPLCEAEHAQVAKPSDASVSGTVVKLAGGAPIKSADVLLTSLADHTHTLSTVTDAGGRFELDGIAAGRYRLRVSHEGFLTQEYGARKPGETGATLMLGSSQNLQEVVFRLVASAVIAGRVINEDGDPLSWAKVTALREAYSNGKRRLTAETMSPTNDLGEYRLFGLRPGRYFVNADYRPGVHSCADSLVSAEDVKTATAQAGGANAADIVVSSATGYVPTFYPGTFDPAKAIAVTVKAGEEISSIEVTVSPTTTFSVRGRVINLASRRSGSPVLTLAPRSNGQSVGLPGRVVPLDAADGPFVIGNVLPGTYTLLADLFDAGTHYRSAQNVEVGNVDSSGLSVVLTPGTMVRGHVTWDGPPSVVRDALQVFLRETDADGTSGNVARTQDGGAFQVNGVFDGTYRVEILGASQNSYLESVHYGATDGLAEGFTVHHGNDAALEVVLSSKGARVQGTVTDSDGLPAVGVWVALVPDDPHRNEMQLFKAVTTDQNGRYILQGIAPGDYKLFSWEDVELKAWEDPEFIRSFEGLGEKVSFDASDQQTVDLHSIRNDSNAN